MCTKQFLKECKETRDAFVKVAGTYNISDNLELRTEIDSLLIMYDQLCEGVRLYEKDKQVTADKVSTLINALDVIANGNPVSVGLEEITALAQSALDYFKKPIGGKVKILDIR